jgi:hypothetical protein
MNEAAKLIRLLVICDGKSPLRRWNHVTRGRLELFLKKNYRNNPLKNQNLRFKGCHKRRPSDPQVNGSLTILSLNVIVICLLRDAARETETVFGGEKHMGSASANKLQGGDPMNDPSVARLLKRKAGLADLLQDLQEGENPLSVPDRPHPTPPKIVVPEPERTPQAVVGAQASVPAELPSGEISEGASAASVILEREPEQNIPPAAQPSQAPLSQAEELQTMSIDARAPAQELPSTLPIQPPMDQATGEQMSRSIVETEPRGRGRPIKARAHKSETSFSLDPELIRELRKESARRQYESGLTVSTSEVVEELLMSGLEQLRSKPALAN